MAVLKESRVAVEEDLKARSAALLQNAEEVAQHRAEKSALRYSGLYVHLCLFIIQNPLEMVLFAQQVIEN